MAHKIALKLCARKELAGGPRTEDEAAAAERRQGAGDAEGGGGRADAAGSHPRPPDRNAGLRAEPVQEDRVQLRQIRTRVRFQVGAERPLPHCSSVRTEQDHAQNQELKGGLGRAKQVYLRGIKLIKPKQL